MDCVIGKGSRDCVMRKGNHGLCHGEGEQGLCHEEGKPWIVSWGRGTMNGVMGKGVH